MYIHVIETSDCIISLFDVKGVLKSHVDVEYFNRSVVDKPGVTLRCLNVISLRETVVLFARYCDTGYSIIVKVCLDF